jgi:hypothetical protein
MDVSSLYHDLGIVGMRRSSSNRIAKSPESPTKRSAVHASIRKSSRTRAGLTMKVDSGGEGRVDSP